MQHLNYEDFCICMNHYAAIARADTSLSELSGYIVYKESNWPTKYPITSRTYEVSSSAKAFNPNMIGTGLFGYCLDGTDQGVRLDAYNWEVDYCYFDSDSWNKLNEYIKPDLGGIIMTEKMKNNYNTYLTDGVQAVRGYKRASIAINECAFAIKHGISYLEAINLFIGENWQNIDDATRALHMVDDTPETVELFDKQYPGPSEAESKAILETLIAALEEQNIHFYSEKGDCVIPMKMTPKQFELAIYRALPNLNDYITISIDKYDFSYDWDAHTSVFSS